MNKSDYALWGLLLGVAVLSTRCTESAAAPPPAVPSVHLQGPIVAVWGEQCEATLVGGTLVPGATPNSWQFSGGTLTLSCPVTIIQDISSSSSSPKQH